jgi:hypothetical protein
MADLVSFEVAPGRDVLIETDSLEEGLVPAGRGPDGIVTAAARFSDRLDVVRDAVTEAMRTLKEGLNPDEISVSFGITFAAQAGAVIARTSLEGTLGVRMVWHRQAES